MAKKKYKQVFLNYKEKCACCGKQQKLSEYRHEWNIDHIKEKQFGGSDDISNLQMLCLSCHKWKNQMIHANQLTGTKSTETLCNEIKKQNEALATVLKRVTAISDLANTGKQTLTKVEQQARVLNDLVNNGQHTLDRVEQQARVLNDLADSGKQTLADVQQKSAKASKPERLFAKEKQDDEDALEKLDTLKGALGLFLLATVVFGVAKFTRIPWRKLLFG